MIDHYGIQTTTMIFVTFLTVAMGCCLADLDLRCKQDGVPLTNSKEYILDLYITKPVWSHVLALSACTLNKALIISYQETRQIPHQPSFTFQTIPDCI